MEEKPHKAKPEQILQFMTTEHFTLQTARSGTIADANGRASVFLGCVSSGVVALAFIGQTSGGDSPAFDIFALVLFPALFFLGLVTFKRTLQNSMEDGLHALGINRIRHYYTEIAPEMREYFVHSIHDDWRGTMFDSVVSEDRFQMFVTTSGTILVINSILVGVWSALAVKYFFAPSLRLVVGIGIAVFVAALAAHYFHQRRSWAKFDARLCAPKFPSPGDGGETK